MPQHAHAVQVRQEVSERCHENDEQRQERQAQPVGKVGEESQHRDPGTDQDRDHGEDRAGHGALGRGRYGRRAGDPDSETDPLLEDLLADGLARRRSITYLLARLEERNADARERADGFLGDTLELLESDLDRSDHLDQWGQ